MSQSILSKVEANWFASILKSTGMDVSEFTMGMIRQGSLDLVQILHKPSGLYFAAGPGAVRETEYVNFDDGWLVVCSPGFEGRFFSHVAQGMNEVRALFQDWPTVFLPEVRAPDLWAELSGDPTLRAAAAAEEEDNRPFREDEKPQVRSAVEEIKRFIEDRDDATQDKLNLAIKRLVRLEEAVERLGRFDWREQLFGVLTQIGLGLAMDSATFKTMWALALSKLRGVLALPPPGA